jgi:hypothetical protein
MAKKDLGTALSSALRAGSERFMPTVSRIAATSSFSSREIGTFMVLGFAVIGALLMVLLRDPPAIEQAAVRK